MKTTTVSPATSAGQPLAAQHAGAVSKPRAAPRKLLSRRAYAYASCMDCHRGKCIASSPGRSQDVHEWEMHTVSNRTCIRLIAALQEKQFQRAVCLLQHARSEDSQDDVYAALMEWLHDRRVLKKFLHELDGRRNDEALPGDEKTTMSRAVASAVSMLHAPVCSVLRLVLKHRMIPRLEHIQLRASTSASLRELLAVYLSRKQD